MTADMLSRACGAFLVVAFSLFVLVAAWRERNRL